MIFNKNRRTFLEPYLGVTIFFFFGVGGGWGFDFGTEWSESNSPCQSRGELWMECTCCRGFDIL